VSKLLKSGIYKKKWQHPISFGSCHFDFAIVFYNQVTKTLKTTGSQTVASQSLIYFKKLNSFSLAEVKVEKNILFSTSPP
jgi:hypothetical protein